MGLEGEIMAQDGGLLQGHGVGGMRELFKM